MIRPISQVIKAIDQPYRPKPIIKVKTATSPSNFDVYLALAIKAIK